MELFDTYFVWFGQVFSCFREENVSHKSPMCISGKITTLPKLFIARNLNNAAVTTLISVAYGV